jgi:hypothetical protein
MIKECCVCRDYLLKDKWYTPSAEERRNDYRLKTPVSHAYCPTCAEIVEREIEKKFGFLEKEVKNETKKTG